MHNSIIICMSGSRYNFAMSPSVRAEAFRHLVKLTSQKRESCVAGRRGLVFPTDKAIAYSKDCQEFKEKPPLYHLSRIKCKRVNMDGSVFGPPGRTGFQGCSNI